MFFLLRQIWIAVAVMGWCTRARVYVCVCVRVTKSTRGAWKLIFRVWGDQRWGGKYNISKWCPWPLPRKMRSKWRVIGHCISTDQILGNILNKEWKCLVLLDQFQNGFKMCEQDIEFDRLTLNIGQSPSHRPKNPFSPSMYNIVLKFHTVERRRISGETKFHQNTFIVF